MGRKRSLTRAELFSAIERVMLAHGPLAVTIEAVAREAGVSKATVLYDYPTKTELVLAFLGDRFQRKRDALEEDAQNAAHPEQAWLQALVQKVGSPQSETDGFAMSFVSEALKPDNPCRALLTEASRADFERITRISPDRRAAIIAHLALHGLASSSAFGAVALDEDDRSCALQAIFELACTGQLSPPDQDPNSTTAIDPLPP